MASKNIELKVGLLVLVGAAIIIGAIWLAKGYRYGQKFYQVSVIFPEVGALALGDPVAVSGVNKGKVREIKLHGEGVLTVLDIASDVELKKDATFTVKNIGLMGERFIAAKTGSLSEALDRQTPARGQFDPGIPEVMGMMGDVIAQMGDLASSLKETVISPQTLDRFSETIANLQKLAARLEASAARNLPRVDTAMADVAGVSRSIRQGWERNQVHFDTAAYNFSAASGRLMNLVDSMTIISEKLDAFATDLNQADGTLRLLLEDRRLYDDLRTTSRRIDSLVTDIRANPKKYINFTLELF